MATAVRRHTIVNPARRNRAKARRSNRAHHRRLSAKQIKYFGTPQQKAALKRKRKHNAAKHHRKHARRTVAKRSNAPKHRSHRAAPRAKKRSSHKRRKNPGEILSLTLGNPAGKRRSMARHHKKNRRHAASGSRRHNRRHNPGRRMNAKHHSYRHRRRNPGGINVTSIFTQGLSALAGLVGSRLLTQAVLGSSNTGAYGYAGNAAATAVLATAAHMLFKGKPDVRNGVIIGGVLGIGARVMEDYTPFGTYLSQAGVGDYAGGGAHGVGVYLPWNGVVAQRYTDALNSAQVQIPSGWAPTVNMPAATTPSGMSGWAKSLY